MAYSFADFRARTTMPLADVDELEANRPGWLAKRCAFRESSLNARLKKRYAVPFASPMPEIVLGWLTDILTLDAYMQRGFNPSSAQDQLIKDAADVATKEIAEAANSETGLFDLPLLESAPGTSGVSQGGPFGYSETSPYTWTDVQREAVRGG